MIVVSNTTPLIGLAKLGHLSLLSEFFGAITIAPSVNEEIRRAPNRPGAQEIQKISWVQVRSIDDQTKVDYLRVDLDPGEAEVLVLAQELAADWVLLDESKARLAAEMLGLRTVGTLGLLLLAKRRGLIEAVRPLLDRLRAEKFYISDRLYENVLQEAGEHRS